MLIRPGMKRRPYQTASLLVVAGLLVLGLAYANRSALRDAYDRMTAPELPQEEPFKPSPPPATSTTTGTPVVTQPPKGTTQPAPVATTTSVGSGSTASPDEKRLAVPFLSQAPFMVWDHVHEEACEEASVLMVRAYYQGKSGRIDPTEGEQQIQSLVTFQQERYGFFESTSATETKRFVEAAFPELSVQVVPLTGAEQIKEYVSQGIPVIIPADGHTLPNPNFRNGGPDYHMLVVRGYTEDRFITNDPGTRKGENFLYTYDGLLDSVHDWNNGDVPHGARVILIVSPRVK